MSTISQPVTKNKIFWLRVMPRLRVVFEFSSVCSSRTELDALDGTAIGTGTNYIRTLLYVRIENAFLLEIVRHGVLC